MKKKLLVLALWGLLSACASTQTQTLLFVKDKIPRSTFTVNTPLKFNGPQELVNDVVFDELIMQMEAKGYQQVSRDADLSVSLYYGDMKEVSFVPKNKYVNPLNNPTLALEIRDARTGNPLLKVYSFAASWSKWPLMESHTRLMKKLLAKLPKAGNPFKPVIRHPNDHSYRWAPYEHY